MSDNPSRTMLETLIDTVYDSLNGYRNASDAADSQAVKSAFANQIERRQSTLDMLNQELVRQGGELVTKGTMAGGLHQVWLKVTELFQSGDRAAIDRVQEGEDYLAGKFETALEETDLDSQTRAIIQRALTEIRQGEQLAEQLGRVGDSTFGQ
ncbi:PA2169 family four-helix-bundle protein [Novosphingobium sp. NPDC080210]|uniref:PA2169 family four-helix-bundle protein n=1 Tax=Novosphingobium sp. NPDC080210 TaxID=3390596 RepID=UPI003CFE04BB